MKKGLLATGIILLVLLLAVFVFVPSQIIIVETGTAQCNFHAARRFVFSDSNWKRWIPTGVEDTQSYSFRINNSFFVSTGVAITRGEENYQTNLVLIPLNIDSTGIEWRDTISTGANPLTRIAKYTAAKTLQHEMATIMDSLSFFLSQKKNVYGVEVFKIRETDRPLISQRIVMTRQPVPQDAYELIAKLRDYARKQGDPGDGAAMKYSSRLDSASYELMVAIPTTKMLARGNGYVPKGLVGGNPIAVDVTGGEASIQRAWEGIEQYKQDYRLSAPAIPYEVMVTDRLKEPDTSKWKTRIVYPTRL